MPYRGIVRVNALNIVMGSDTTLASTLEGPFKSSRGIDK